MIFQAFMILCMRMAFLSARDGLISLTFNSAFCQHN
jgi:hypothetical protein